MSSEDKDIIELESQDVREKDSDVNFTIPDDSGANKKEKKGKKDKNIQGKLVATGFLVFGIALGSAVTLTSMRESIVNEVLASLPGEAVQANASNDVSINTVSDMSTYSTSNIIANVTPSVVSIGVLSNPDSEMISGAGTGLIFDKDEEKTYIVTNNHVVSGARGVKVWFDGIEEPATARLVGTDPNYDLAVISVSNEELNRIGMTDVVCAKFGNSDDIRVGDSVIAIGNAMGEGISSTGGMISMKSKNISDSKGKELTVIQTDASINPGNSGGPLVNSKGEVIGINTAKLVQTFSTSVEGVGYAVPSNDVIKTIDQIISNSDKAYLGIKGRTIDATTAELFSLPTMGVYVGEVIEGGSAEAGGILTDDIITSFDGNTVTDIDTLQSLIKDTKVGSVVPVIVYRNGEKVKLDVTMQKHQDVSFS